MKLVKLQNLVAKCCKIQKIYIALRSLHIFSIFVLRAEIVNIFGSTVTISARNTNILKICKFRKAIYIFCILQHFVTKFCNFTDFDKFFTGMYFFLSKSKTSLTCKLSILDLGPVHMGKSYLG